MNTLASLPENLKKYFWDCQFELLRMDLHATFITERILNFGNQTSVKWLLAHVDKEFLQQVIEKSRHLDRKTRNYWKLMLW